MDGVERVRGTVAKADVGCFHIGRSRLLLVFGLCVTLSAVAAQATATAQAGLLLFGPDGGSAATAPALQTDVEIAVNGILARARVTQRFRNPTDRWLEGRYVFPLPDDAAVDRLHMRIGDRRVEGEIQERAQAERTYAVARATGQVASLVRQQRPNIFTTAVANIPPGELVEVEIEYQQRLAWGDTAFSLRFPMVVAPRYIPGAPLQAERVSRPGQGWAANTDQVPDAAAITPPVALQAPADFQPLRLRIDLNAGLPLAAVESLNHPVQVDAKGPGHYALRLLDGSVAAHRDFVLQWRPAASSQPQAALFREQWQDRHYALMMLMPPTAPAPTVVSARELILVIDTSGSMHGASLEQARAGVLGALSRLRPQDRFNIIQFNSTVDSVFASARLANAANLRRARRYVGSLRADGGTEMRPALQRALSHAQPGRLIRQVVFLTDGAVGNEQALFALIQQRLGDSRLFTVGIGSAPNAYFMRRAARFGRGSFTFIGAAGEVEAKIAALFAELSQPVLTDLDLAWELPPGAPPVEQAVEVLPDLYAGRPLVVAIAGAQPPLGVTIKGRFGTSRWTHHAPLHGGAAAPGVHALWARRRIEEWLDARVSGVDPEQIRAAVVTLALAHHLVSPFTSLVAVDKTPSRPANNSLRSSSVPVRLPAGWSAEAVFGRLPATATPAPLFALLGLLALLSALGLWWDGRRRCA